MSDSRSLVPQLSPREWQCVVMIAEGLSCKEIAAKLKISESTVRKYLRDASGKVFGMEVVNPVFLTRYAVSVGWVSKEWELKQ